MNNVNTRNHKISARLAFLGKKKSDLAKSLGVDATKVVKYLGVDSTIGKDLAVARCLGVDPSWLIDPRRDVSEQISSDHTTFKFKGSVSVIDCILDTGRSIAQIESELCINSGGLSFIDEYTKSSTLMRISAVTNVDLSEFFEVEQG